MTERRTWATLSLGILVIGFMSAGFITIGVCFPPADPRPAQALMLGVPFAILLVLAYLALAERDLRWRIPEFALNVFLALPAFAAAGVVARVLLGALRCPDALGCGRHADRRST